MMDVLERKTSETTPRRKIGKITTDGSTAGMRAFGRMIMDLALDHSKIPQTQAEIRALLLANGVTIPPEVRQIDIIAQTKEHVVLTIPPTDMMEQSLRELQAEQQAGKKYSIPLAYSQMASGSFSGTLTDFYEVRVADYTLGFCR